MTAGELSTNAGKIEEDIENYAIDDSTKLHAGDGYTLEVEDLSYTVEAKDGKVKATQKTIIHPISFKIKPKKMMAIMGASGAGKSTLLDILALNISQSSVSGEYLMNEKPIPASFKRASGYVMQSDALYPLLTVRETLQYAAYLRIPNMSAKDKMKVAEDTISALKLNACADTIVGDELHRGVSGGEKRRLSIGIDIIHQPSIIFLDEPTSGLDSTTALQIVSLLNSICLNDRTVAMTIHQPSSRVLDIFSTVIFLSKGYLVYNGPPRELSDRIGSLTKQPLPQFANLSELFLELIDTYEKGSKVEELAQHNLEAEKQRQPSAVSFTDQKNHSEQSFYANSFFTETLILLRRNMKNTIKTPELFIIRFNLCVVVALVLGSLYWNLNLNDKETEDIVKLAGYIAYLEAFFLFTSLEVLPIFLNERSVFVREYSRGAYRLISFVLANFLVILPFLFINAVVFIAITFFMLDLNTSDGNFIYHILMTFVTMTGGNSFATFVSSIVPDPLTGNGAGTAVFAFMFLFGGFFIKQSAIPVGWIWLNYLSMFRYPFQGLIKSNIDIDIDDNVQREEYLKQYDVEGGNRWTSFGAMIAFTVGLRFLFWAVLRFRFGGKHG